MQMPGLPFVTMTIRCGARASPRIDSFTLWSCDFTVNSEVMGHVTS